MRKRRELRAALAGATSTRAALVCCQDREENMDGSAFDRLVRHIGEDGSRRGLLKSAFATVAGFGVVSVVGFEDAEADSCNSKCNKKTKNQRAQCKKNCNGGLSENKACTKDKQCNSKKNLVCDIPFGASNGDDKKCCRGEGASCSSIPGGPQCCTGEAGRREFKCEANVCQPCPNGLCE
jgi:hypothetical protein